jgi:hypothetical protein
LEEKMLVNGMVKLRESMPVNRPAWMELEDSLKAALESYANVHRGSGQYSLATTHLFEQARLILHRFLGLSAGDQIFFVRRIQPIRSFVLWLKMIFGCFPVQISDWRWVFVPLACAGRPLRN